MYNGTVKQAPILVTGAPRSSTTFLGKMLALPGHVLYVDEPFNVQTGIEGLQKTFPSPLHEAGLNGLDMEYAEVVEQLLKGDAQFRPSELRPATKNPLRQLARELWVSREFLDYKWQSKNPLKQRYLIKDPMAFSLSEYLHRRFDMEAVVIMRHPLSTIASYKRLNWHYDTGEVVAWARTMCADLEQVMQSAGLAVHGEVEQWALFWLAVNGVLENFIERNPAMLFVTHEELSLFPHDTLERLYGQLGLPFTARIKQKVTEHTNPSNPINPTDNRIHVLHRNSAENLNRWKHILTVEEAEVIQKITGPFVSRYYPESSWA